MQHEGQEKIEIFELRLSKVRMIPNRKSFSFYLTQGYWTYSETGTKSSENAYLREKYLKKTNFENLMTRWIKVDKKVNFISQIWKLKKIGKILKVRLTWPYPELTTVVHKTYSKRLAEKKATHFPLNKKIYFLLGLINVRRRIISFLKISETT